MKASNGFHRLMIFLVALAVLGCSEQPGQSKTPAKTDLRIPATGKIRSVGILPENPTPETTLEADVLIRGDEPEWVNYQWFRNGDPIPGAITAQLSNKYLQKGDFISLQVRSSWAGGGVDTAESDIVVIGNSLPVVHSISFEPRPAGTNDDLKAVVKGSDRDGDKVDFFYEWSVNGSVLGDQDDPILPSTYYQRNDKVEVAVTPTDGTDEGKTVRGYLHIANTPPEIVSMPPETIITQGSYTYAVQAQDADGDPIRFSLEGNAPDGMTINARTGLVKWRVKLPDEEITYVFEVLAEDSEGEIYGQTVTIRLVPQQVEVSPAQ
jgi:hypothetical protein